MPLIRESDRYQTPAEILDLAVEQFRCIDLDPCSDPDDIVPATLKYDIRRGDDGLSLTWPALAKVFVNPPYSRGSVALWAAKCAEHARNGGECLLLINASTDAVYWRNVIWPSMAGACFLSPRVYFTKAGSAIGTQHTQASVVCYFGHDLERFSRVWSQRGTIAVPYQCQLEAMADDLADKLASPRTIGEDR